jgi:hypothetical protein
MRQNSLRHLAEKGTAGGEETSRKIPRVVPADGDGADEGLSQRLGAGGGTGHRTILYQWQRKLEHTGESSARVTSPVRELRRQVRDLKRLLGEKTLEVDFFKGALQKVEARRQSGRGSGGTASSTRFGS